jgi:hypothetical protein
MGEVDWNPDLGILRSRILAWNLMLSKMQGCRVGSQYLQRSITAADLPEGTFNIPLPKAILAQRANFKAYKLAKKEHIASRETWLQTLARSKSTDDGKSEEHHIRSLISIEKQRRQARNVKRMNINSNPSVRHVS